MFNDESFEKKGLMAESFASDYEDAYDEMLDEMGAAVLSQYSVSRMLRETDPIAYDVGMNDYESSLLADHQYDSDMYSEMFDEDEELTSEGEKMLKEMYDEMLDESGVEALLNNYDASRLLKETDPIAYRVGLSDYESSMEKDDRNVYRDMAMQRKGMMAETFGAETFEATDVGKRMKCRGCGQSEFVRGVAMNNFLQDDKGKWRCYDCLYDKPKHKVVVIGRGKHKPFVSEAETFGADYKRKYQKINVDDDLRKKVNILKELNERIQRAINDNSFTTMEREELRKANNNVSMCMDMVSGGYFGAETFEAKEKIDLSKSALKDRIREYERKYQDVSVDATYDTIQGIGLIDELKRCYKKAYTDDNWNDDTKDIGYYGEVIDGEGYYVYSSKIYKKKETAQRILDNYIKNMSAKKKNEIFNHGNISIVTVERNRMTGSGWHTINNDYMVENLYAETFGAEKEEMCQMCGEKADGMIDEKFAICHDCDTSFGSFERSKGFKKFDAESSGLTRLPSDEPNFDPQKADRNKDGKISSWERTVGNKVAKGIREGRKTSSKGIDTFAEPFEDIGISKPYARLGVIAAGITALAFGVKKLRK